MFFHAMSIPSALNYRSAKGKGITGTKMHSGVTREDQDRMFLGVPPETSKEIDSKDLIRPPQ